MHYAYVMKMAISTYKRFHLSFQKFGMDHSTSWLALHRTFDVLWVTLANLHMSFVSTLLLRTLGVPNHLPKTQVAFYVYPQLSFAFAVRWI